jgi:hypothetical protein
MGFNIAQSVVISRHRPLARCHDPFLMTRSRSSPAAPRRKILQPPNFQVETTPGG